MRVAVVSDAPSERNGVGSYYADLVAQLQSRGAHAEHFCPVDHRAWWLRKLAPPLPGDYTQRLWFPRPLRLWRRVTSAEPNVIVVPTPGPFGMIGLLAARRLGVPLIVGFHTDFEALTSIYWTAGFSRACRWYLESCNRLLFRNSEVVLANSEDMLGVASSLGAHQTELMGTSVAREFIDRPTVPCSPSADRILFAGRLAEEKNLPAVLALARARPGIQVSIAGDGPLRHAVKAAAAELPNLNYLGWITRSQLIEQLDAHDFLMLPSSVESFGTVALEAMARGRPPIVSSACGIVDWPELERGLFKIAMDETPTQTVDRVRSLPLGLLREKARAAREAALSLNASNLNSWLERLSRRKPRAFAESG
ncbi:MAG: glycosyltransferase [Gammaproteobacteria bacterium]